MLAWITPRQIDGGAGSVIDILAAETAAALNLPGAKCYAIRDLAAKELIRFGSGEQVLRPYEDVWPQLRAQVWERERKTREIVAISRSEFINLSKSKLKDWRKEQLRTPEDSERQLEALKVRLAADIKQRGDKRIESPIESASRFIEGVKSQASTIFSHEGGPADQILRSQDIDPGELDPECTLGDVFALGTFRHRLRVVSGIMSRPYSELKARVREDQLPSCIIQGAINRYRQDAPERKGSDLADSYLACLAAYADVTYVDKRTAENLRRALPKSPECAALLGRVEKAGSYPTIVSQLRS
jgi:hypothetical protein